MQTLAILGRQPAIGLAELESLLGADKITPLQGGGVLLDVESTYIPFSRLGGTVKLGDVLTLLTRSSGKTSTNSLFLQAKSILVMYLTESSPLGLVFMG